MNNMRKHAILDNNIVVEVSDINDAEYEVLIKTHQLLIDVQDFAITPQVGWILDGNKLVPPSSEQTPIPVSVTSRQIRLALLYSGISLSVIDAAINSMPEPTKSVARVTWDYSTLVFRNNPMIATMQPALGLTKEQIDQLFILASTL